MAPPRVIIVGAGPAGTRCAEALVAAGLCPIVIDEGRRSGGQIYRRQPDNFRRSYETLYGTEAGRAQAIHRTFDGLAGRIEYRPDTLVWNIAGREIFTVSAGRQEILPFDALVLCTGATDRLMPVKGWNLPGVFTLGGAQVALKAQACAIGQRVVFLGTGPLLYLVAAQYRNAGADIEAVFDTSAWPARIAAVPRMLSRPSVLWKGAMLALSLAIRRIPVATGITPLAIEGDGAAGVRAVTVRDARGLVRTVACDAVALGWHLRPETQLADLAKCEFAFDQETRQWLPRSDADGRSSVPGIYLAGDGQAIRGAGAAEIGGQLAAAAVLADLAGLPMTPAALRLRTAAAAWRRFARGVFRAFPWPHRLAAALPDDAVICRCETISAGDLRRVVHETGAREANRAKAFSRVGMGRCQGRYCGHAGAEVIAAAAGVPVEQVGRLRGQAPVKPLPVAIEEAAE